MQVIHILVKHQKQHPNDVETADNEAWYPQRLGVSIVGT